MAIIMAPTCISPFQSRILAARSYEPTLIPDPLPPSSNVALPHSRQVSFLPEGCVTLLLHVPHIKIAATRIPKLSFQKTYPGT